MAASDDATADAPLTVVIKTMTRQSFKLDLDVGVQIKAIKDKLIGEKHVNWTDMKLIYNGAVLEDDTLLKDINYDTKKFLVVIEKKAAAPSTSATATKPADVAQSTAAASNELADPAVEVAVKAPPADASKAGAPVAGVASAATPADASGSLTEAQLTEMTNQITSMGFNREQALEALKAANYNVNIALGFLLGEDDSAPRAAAPPATGAPTPATAANEGGGQVTLESLANNEQFQQMLTLVRSNPALLQPMMAAMQQQNPQIMSYIQQNQEEFLELVNAHEETSGDEEGDGGNVPPGHNVQIVLSEQEAQDIAGLRAMGFPEALCLEGYLACDKDAALAVNYILARMEEPDLGN